jgi:hypothetical protein
MSAPGDLPRAGARDPGLCATCRHAQIIETKHSVFWLCRLSRVDPRFAKYPRLPVLRCSGYEPRDAEAL